MDPFFETYRADRLPVEKDLISDWAIWRAKPGRDVPLIIWSDDIFGCRTHWWGGRTTPCRKEGCPACAVSTEDRWNGWVFAKLVNTEEKVIFEFTPPAGLALDEMFVQFGTLKGVQIIATRKSDRANGQVHVRCKGQAKDWRKIPTAPAIVPAMCRIWGVRPDMPIVVGGMDAQPLSEAERVKMKGKEERGVKYNRIPQTSLLQPAPAAPVEASAAELLDAIAGETFINGASIKRVNGKRHK